VRDKAFTFLDRVKDGGYVFEPHRAVVFMCIFLYRLSSPLPPQFVVAYAMQVQARTRNPEM
jgi:hypothetical protein